MSFYHSAQTNADRYGERLVVYIGSYFLPKSANVSNEVLNQVKKNDDSKKVVTEVSSILKQSGEEMKTLGVKLSKIGGGVVTGIWALTTCSDYISPSCTAEAFHSRSDDFSPVYPYRIFGYAVGSGLAATGAAIYSIGSFITSDESFLQARHVN